MVLIKINVQNPNAIMSLSEAIVTGLKYAIVGAGIGGALGLVKTAAFSSADVKESYPTSLRNATEVHKRDEVYGALIELSHLRYRAPIFFDTLCTSMNMLVTCEEQTKKSSAANDRKAVVHWRFESKRAADAALNATRHFRSVIESDMPSALTVFDEAAAIVQDTVEGCLHNILMESASMLS